MAGPIWGFPPCVELRQLNLCPPTSRKQRLVGKGGGIAVYDAVADRGKLAIQAYRAGADDAAVSSAMDMYR
jgi:hypothetical protein